jgi:hypothetical protein
MVMLHDHPAAGPLRFFQPTWVSFGQQGWVNTLKRQRISPLGRPTVIRFLLVRSRWRPLSGVFQPSGQRGPQLLVRPRDVGTGFFNFQERSNQEDFGELQSAVSR